MVPNDDPAGKPPADKPAADKPSPPPADSTPRDPSPDTAAVDDASPPAEEPPSQYRLVPADWTVDAVVFYTGETDDNGTPVSITVQRPGPTAPAYVVAADEADPIIALAAEQGVPLIKEAVK